MKFNGLSWLNRFSFKSKIAIIITLITTLFTLSLVISYYGLTRLTTRYDKTLATERGVHFDLKNLSILMLMARRHEKDFILRKKDKYIKQHLERTTAIRNLVGKNKNILIELMKEDKFNSIIKDIDNYEEKFSDLVERFKKEGTSKAGLRGSMRKNAHNIEKIIKKHNLTPQTYIKLLTIRRREKDYLLRRDKKYLAKAKNDAQALLKELKSTSNDGQIYKSVEEELNQYLKTFKDVTINYDGIIADIASFRKSIHHFESFLKEANLQVSNSLDIEVDQLHQFKTDEVRILVVIFITSLFSIGIIGAFLWSLSKKLTFVTQALKQSSDSTSEFSNGVRDASQQVSQSTTQQSSAIQETVTTLDQIKAMVEKSVESAGDATKYSDQSHSIANEGKSVVQNVISAVNDISTANQKIMLQMNQNNEQLDMIVNIISDINNKTNVINDIVFQTKLLSFNASVEAARAGEHGKGFAIVAEEVGSLAKMSGNASTEIAQMLEQSILKVNSITESTQKEVQELSLLGKDKTEHAVLVANECNDKLSEIVKSAKVIKDMINEIDHASKEQEMGVSSISKAMNDLDQATHSNSDTANKTFDLSKKLDKETTELNTIIAELEEQIVGKNN
jgi:methyl-accepting chemotaxis protein